MGLLRAAGRDDGSCLVLREVKRLSVSEPYELRGSEGDHVASRPGAGPHERLREQRLVDEHAPDAHEREGSYRPGLEARDRLHLLWAGDPCPARIDGPGHLARVATAVARH